MALSSGQYTRGWGRPASQRARRQGQAGVVHRCAAYSGTSPPSAHRRQLLAGGALLVGLGAAHSPPCVAAAASTVFHEVAVPLPIAGDDGVPLREPPTRVKATGRIVAIGDLHGDLDKTLASLRLARVVEGGEGGAPLRWAGGDATVVQLGDVLDRGNVEIGIIKLLMDLDDQARREGGAVYMLNGNHESLNVCGDFRYVTPGAFIESAVEFGLPRDVALRNWDGCIQARAALFLPGGRAARMLSRNPTVLVVNDTAFAHGGLLPVHVAYGIERMNAEVAAWMRRDRTPDGFASPPFLAMGDGKSVMWNRQLSVEKWNNPIDRFHAAAQVGQALREIGAKRLVVGHTPQMRGANAELDGMVWRIDVGMSSGVLDAPVAVLEITRSPGGGDDVVRIVSEGLGMGSLDEPEGLLDV
ncbi:ser thr phosphatase [Raphidocelis subcapitata]|uniref:Ser thr phosphatase n=1 Tax=Raphidocelis subcapitata TaxID=307507 RepID=A0A2V0PF50_9CHLO|nr:ser thr phosphatase [Raphidocelis subcapitata]|eukprot:GBF98464.1 ser thr phosphatase [Raphidocelis subcapitata]